VTKVDELMAWVDALETQLATARTTATALLAAAHASTQADRLAAINRGYLRTYFPDLEVMKDE